MARLKPEAKKALVEGRREQLLRSALRLMAERGFAQTSMEDIARAAGVAKGTVYLYFPNKEALLAAVLETQTLLPAVMPLLSALKPGASLEATLRTVVPVLWQALKTREDAVRILLQEASSRSSYSLRFLERTLPLNEKLAAQLGLLRGASAAKKFDPYVAIRALVAMLLGLFVEQEIFGGKKLRPMTDDAIISTVTTLFLRGAAG